MNWQERAGAAPHGEVFYGFMVAAGGLGVAIFCYVAVANPTDAPLVWRIAFAVPGFFFLLGMLQALERLVLPEQAQARSSRLTESARLRVLLGRWIAIAASLGGWGVVTVVRFFSGPGTQDVCDDLRILFFSLIFLCFCFADLAGEAVFPASMWTTAWQPGAKDGSGGLAKRRRRRRSLY